MSINITDNTKQVKKFDEQYIKIPTCLIGTGLMEVYSLFVYRHQLPNWRNHISKTADDLNIGETKLKQILKQMKELQLITKHGNTQNGYYTLNEETYKTILTMTWDKYKESLGRKMTESLGRKTTESFGRKTTSTNKSTEEIRSTSTNNSNKNNNSTISLAENIKTTDFSNFDKPEKENVVGMSIPGRQAQVDTNTKSGEACSSDSMSITGRQAVSSGVVIKKEPVAIDGSAAKEAANYFGLRETESPTLRRAIEAQAKKSQREYELQKHKETVDKKQNELEEQQRKTIEEFEQLFGK